MAVVSSWRELLGSVLERAQPSCAMLECMNFVRTLLALHKLPVRDWRKVGMTSSPHDPYGLGYTRATMAMTIGSKDASLSESSKVAAVQIVVCNSTT